MGHLRGLRFDLLALVLLGTYLGIAMAMGEVEAVLWSLPVIGALLGVFQMYSRVRTVGDFLGWFGTHWSRDWRLLVLLPASQFLPGMMHGHWTPWEGIRILALFFPGCLALLAWKVRSSGPRDEA